MKLQEFYASKVADFDQKAEALKAKYIKFSVVRLILFVIGIGLFIYAVSSFAWYIVVLYTFIFLLGFARFVFWHLKIQKQQKHFEFLSIVNKNELSALKNDTSVFDGGKEFIDVEHPYSVDLDIFGDYSFFQYCNRTSTAIGKHCLANYLKKVADKQEIKLRNEAITELQPMYDWRQDFQAFGMSTDDEIQHVKALKIWLKEPPFVKGNQLLIAASYFAPIWMILSILITVLYLPWQAILLFLIPPALILKNTLDRVNKTHVQTTHAEKILAFYADLIHHIEQKDFNSEKLTTLKKAFLNNEKTASSNIRRLSYIIRQLNVRYNAFAIILNIISLWDLHWVRSLEKWKAAQQDHLLDWFESLQEFEALISFATLHFNNPEWTFPQIFDDPHFTGEEIGHPLIDLSERISNDLEMPTEGHIKLVTGSNMAGKSTFLRTIGLNIVLAMSGAPVCAKKFELPMLDVYTSMRTQDALHESTSSFYAELKRLKFIIEAVEDRKPGENDVFFLLDEILKGTNSKDRHTGSKALIRQLIKSQGSGIIATHDLELGALEAEAKGTVENLCIEVEVKNDELFFDYKIKKGISQSFNATLLMKNMGIRIDE